MDKPRFRKQAKSGTDTVYRVYDDADTFIGTAQGLGKDVVTRWVARTPKRFFAGTFPTRRAAAEALWAADQERIRKALRLKPAFEYLPPLPKEKT